MPDLIAQNSDTATGATLDAALRIGRGSDNDVVLDHPTVSRHHAIIERVGSAYFIRDLGSRNMTRLNGRTLRARRPLTAGDGIRFGQVRVTFAPAGDPSAPPVLERSQANASPSGIVFNCVCGVRLWAKDEAVSGVVTCRKCHAKVVVPAESTNADSGETVCGVAFSASAAPEGLAAPVQSGMCSICQWPTNTEDAITTCPACGLTFHAECWCENGGCSAYGCAQVNALTPQQTASAHEPEWRPTAMPPASPLEPAPRGIPAGHAMLGASVIAGLIGLLIFGAFPLIVLMMSLVALAQRRPAKEKKLLLLAVAIAIFGAVAGACVSLMVWLGWSPGVTL